jgi:hypothetical protein
MLAYNIILMERNEHDGYFQSITKRILVPIITIGFLHILVSFELKSKDIVISKPTDYADHTSGMVLRDLQEGQEVFDFVNPALTVYKLTNFHVYKGKWKSEQELFNFGERREGDMVAHTKIYTDITNPSRGKTYIGFTLLDGPFVDNWVEIRSQTTFVPKPEDMQISNDSILLGRFHSNVFYGEYPFSSYLAKSNCDFMTIGCFSNYYFTTNLTMNNSTNVTASSIFTDNAQGRIDSECGFSLTFELMTYQDEGVYMKFFLYSIVISVLAILQILNSAWLVKRIQDSETNSKTVNFI